MSQKRKDQPKIARGTDLYGRVLERYSRTSAGMGPVVDLRDRLGENVARDRNPGFHFEPFLSPVM
jgi:hypothetical protein